jgi:sugar phosphate isomerase/epimerase
MQIGCSTSAWKNSLDDALDAIAALGFRRIDQILIKGWDQLLPSELAEDYDNHSARFRRALERTGLLINAFNVAVDHWHERADEVRAKREKELRAVFRLQRELGVAVSGFYPGYWWREGGRSWEDIFETSVASFSEMLDLAKAEGVVAAVELHFNTPFETLEQSHRLLDALPALPVVYDPTHFVMQGFRLEETLPLMRRAVHCHLRDAKSGVIHAPLGTGTVDFEWVLEELHALDYRGNVSIEYLTGFKGDLTGELQRLKVILERAVAGLESPATP